MKSSDLKNLRAAAELILAIVSAELGGPKTNASITITSGSQKLTKRELKYLGNHGNHLKIADKAARKAKAARGVETIQRWRAVEAKHLAAYERKTGVDGRGMKG